MDEESFARVACLFVRENENTGVKEVLFARAPGGELFFIPGGRRVEVAFGQDAKDKQVLVHKIKLDLAVDLVTDDDAFKKYTSFGAPAFGKEEGIMVESHYFFASEYLGTLRTTPQIYALEWRSYKDCLKDINDRLFTKADKAVMLQLYEEGII